LLSRWLAKETPSTTDKAISLLRQRMIEDMTIRNST